MLIKNIEEANYVMNLSKSVTYPRLVSHLKNAETTYIIKLIGQSTYDQLLAYHDGADNFFITSPSFTSTYTEPAEGETPEATKHDYMFAVLLWYAQHAMLNMAYSIGFEVLNAYISDAGFARPESNTTKSMYKYQEDNLKRYFVKSGMDSMDRMLEILEENKDDIFTSFQQKYAEIKSNIFPSTASFNAHYNINNSRIIFTRLKQHIKTVEKIKIEPIIGEENLTFMLAELPKTTPDTKALKLLPYVRDVVAHLAVVMLMEESGAEISERGLFFTGMRSINDSGLELPTIEARLTDLIARNNQIAESYIVRLKRYMANSGEWTMPESPRDRIFSRDNTNKKTFFA